MSIFPNEHSRLGPPERESAGRNHPPSPFPFHEPAVGRDIALRCPAAQRRPANALPTSCRQIKHPRTEQRAIPTRFRGSRREPCSGNSLPSGEDFNRSGLDFQAGRSLIPADVWGQPQGTFHFPPACPSKALREGGDGSDADHRPGLRAGVTPFISSPTHGKLLTINNPKARSRQRAACLPA